MADAEPEPAGEAEPLAELVAEGEAALVVDACGVAVRHTASAVGVQLATTLAAASQTAQAAQAAAPGAAEYRPAAQPVHTCS